MQISRKIFDIEDFRIFFLRLNNMKVESVGKRMTTIGRQLQKFRMLLGLSQTEMAAGIVTDSFYSKVERNISEISIDKLIKILNIHHISLFDFFEIFDVENLSNLKRQQEIYSAYDNRNIKQLKEFAKLVKDNDDFLYLKIRLMIAGLERRVNKLSLTFRKKVSNSCFDIRICNLYNFWNLAILALLIKFEKLNSLIEIIEINIANFHFENNDQILSLLNLLINYLDRAYQIQYKDGRNKVISILNFAPDNLNVMFHHIIIQYYVALLNQDWSVAKEIIELLKMTGYQEYVNTLPKIV
ncbi:helix-turn-helix domain-containing protein [Lactobacillus intestinalis]|uniref:helix-turn-helix domain-containing protein n=1 Tax=Lactobacillus intestinalis TaxID=151781 RepID=UPI00242E58B5|nr:helix-turn-helix transcriptional regulator [Lactobacillus intestinalis]